MSKRISVDEAKLRELVAANWSQSRMGRHFGCSDSTVALRMAEIGLKSNAARFGGNRRGIPRPTQRTISPDDPGLEAKKARAYEIRELSPWPAGMVFEDAAVPREVNMGYRAARPPEATYQCCLEGID